MANDSFSMAVAFEGFSIRGYTAKMRSINFDKCWPFDGGDGGGGGPRSLPEISVRKFRFWSDELKTAAAEGKKPDDDGDDAELEVAIPSAKAKQKTPKKRSIVELFAVAPPIEAAESDEAQAEDEEEEARGKELEGEKKGKIVKVNKVKKATTKRKIKRHPKVEICAPKKGKINKPTSSSQTLQTLQGSMCKLNKSNKPFDSGKKPVYIKNLAKNRKFKGLKSSKPISKKNLGKCHSVHSTPNDSARRSIKKTGTKATTPSGSFKKPIFESDNHTAFSGKDDIIEHTKSCSTIDIPQLRNLCKIFSDVLAASSALDTCKGHHVAAAADASHAENTHDIDVAAVERNNGTLSEKGQLSESHSDLMPCIYPYPSGKNCSDTEGAVVSLSTDQHHSVRSCNDVDHVSPGTSVSLASDRHSDDPRILDTIRRKEFSSHSDIQVNETCPMTSDSHSLISSVQMCASRSDATGSPSFIRNPSPRHSTSCSLISIMENGRQLQQPVDPLMESCWQISDCQPICQRPSKDLMPSMHSSEGARSKELKASRRPSVGPRMVPHQVITCKDKCINEGFVGLPLNSQGELIHLNSGAKFGYRDMRTGQSVMQGSTNSYPVPNYAEPRTSGDHVKIIKGKFPGATLNPKNQSSWFQEQYFQGSEPAISGNQFTNSQGFERFGVQRNTNLSDKEHLFLHDSNRREVTCNRCREDNRTQNYIDRVNFHPEGIKDHVQQPIMQQTVRLMGTNVTVSRHNKGCHVYDDGRVWTDKEVVSDNRASSRASEKPHPRQWLQQPWVPNQSYGMTNNNFFHPLDVSSNRYHMPTTAARLGLTQSNCRPQWVSRNASSSTTGNQCMKVDLFSHPLNSQSSLNEASKSIVASNQETAVNAGNGIPFMASNPHKVYQQTLLNSTHCMHSQGLAYSTSTCRPPFLLQETRGSIQPKPPHASSSNLPWWLLNTKQQIRGQEPPCSCYSDAVPSRHHGNMASTAPFCPPPSYPTSTVSFHVCTAPTSQMSSVATPSAVQCSFISPCTTSKPRDALDNSCRMQNMNGGTNSNFTYLKCLDTAGKNRKRHAAKDDVFMKPAKKPFLKMQYGARASAGPSQGEQAHRHASQAKKAADAKNPEITSEKEGSRSMSVSCSLKSDGVSKSGPVKLCSGAKHILKPSQGMDQDNSRPTHSTVPFSLGNTAGKGLDLQMKAAEIYRF